jgi:hypothetical protein
MDDVEIDLVDLEPPQALLHLGRRILAAWIELRGDEDLLARNAAGLQSSPHTGFVAIGLGGIDVALSEL